MQQMTLAFEPGLSGRFRSLLEVVAAGVYQRGLGRVAAMVDVAPSHLSAQLSGTESRRLPADTLETYIEKSGDLTPIFYLVDKFCRDPQVTQAEAMSRLAMLMEQLMPLAQQAGVMPAMRAAKGRRGG